MGGNAYSGTVAGYRFDNALTTGHLSSYSDGGYGGGNGAPPYNFAWSPDGNYIFGVDGDGGFLLNMQELYTLRANPDLPIAIFILNNRGYKSISQSQTRAFQSNFGASAESGLSEIDFEVIAKLGGLDYVECKTYFSLKEVIGGINSASRILIDVLLDDDSYRGPSITTKFDSQGRPYSTDIGEVSWR